MGDCSACPAPADGVCPYCERPVCPEHRRPSRHACTGPAPGPSTPQQGADADRGRDPIRLGTALVLATVLVALAILIGTTFADVPRTTPADANETEVERLVHHFVNTERTARSRTVLAWNATLARMARDHSTRMARRDIVGHGPIPLSDRFARYGLDCNGGENVYALATVGGPVDERMLARRTVAAWLDSPGHRETLLGRRFDAHGIGVVIDRTRGRSTVYVTQDLC